MPRIAVHGFGRSGRSLMKAALKGNEMGYAARLAAAAAQIAA